MKTASFGTISHGTMQARDLIPAFADELRALRGSLPISLHNAIRALKGDFESDDASELVNELADELNNYAPSYGYFGAHAGDGSDYGFWLSEDWQQSARDDGALEVSDLSEVPADYRGLVVHVNDHGNATLYGRGGSLVIWSIV